MRSSALRIIHLISWLLLSFNNASAAGPPLPKALADAPAVSTALNNILEIAKTGSRTRWDSPSGRHGFITINRTWFPKPDQPCREYLRSLVNPGGKPILLHGTGCRDSNGLWMLLETQRGSKTTIGSGSDCPPESAAAPALTSRSLSPARPIPIRRSPPSSIRTLSSSATDDGDDGGTTSSPAKSTSRNSPAKTSSKAASKSSSTAGSSSKTTRSKPAPATPADPAAAAVIEASQPTAADW